MQHPPSIPELHPPDAPSCFRLGFSGSDRRHDLTRTCWGPVRVCGISFICYLSHDDSGEPRFPSVMSWRRADWWRHAEEGAATTGRLGGGQRLRRQSLLHRPQNPDHQLDRPPRQVRGTQGRWSWPLTPDRCPHLAGDTASFNILIHPFLHII